MIYRPFMKKMAELNSGSLVKFLQQMHVDGIANTFQDSDKPVLLQIRSIIPVLREGDLWPNQGFFLRVSDLSHSIYVSLPQEQDDMVLCDKLHIGQFLYVEKLEAAYPVPLIKGIRPIPGRHPCLGNPKDLISIHSLEKFLGVPNLESVNDEHVDVIKKPIETPQSLTNSEARSTDVIKEKQREKSLYMNASSDEGIVQIWSLNSMKEENNDVIKEEKKQSEESQSLNDSRECSNEVVNTIEEINNKSEKKQTEKSQSLSASKSGSLNGRIGRRTSSISKSRKSDSESMLNYKTKRKDAESYYKGLRKHKLRYGFKDGDVESTVSASSTSSMLFKRRSWSGKEATRIAGEISEPPIVKHEVKPDGSSAGVSICSSHSSRNYSSDDNSSSITEKTVTTIPARSSPTKSSNPSMAKTSEEACDQRETFSSTNDQISADSNISWDFLPSSLVKLGQEVLKQRDIALLAAVEALLDASASERLLKCLSIFSDMLSTKEDEPRPSLERFFSLENNLDQTKSIFRTSTDILPPKKADADSSTIHCVDEEIKLALERKQNANTWIKAALESDLNPVSEHVKTINVPTLGTNAPKIPTKKSHGNIPKGPLTLKKERSNTALQAGIMENQEEWIKGRSLPISVELANSLDNESRAWFLSYIEDYLDWVGSKTCSSESDSHVPEIMYKIKKVSDWLDMTCKDKSTLRDSEIDACGRVRNKIYEILMKHVERTTMSAIVES